MFKNLLTSLALVGLLAAPALADQRFDLVLNAPITDAAPQNLGLGLDYKLIKVGHFALAGGANATYNSKKVFVAPEARVTVDLGKNFDFGIGATQRPNTNALNVNNYQATASIGLKL